MASNTCRLGSRKPLHRIVLCLALAGFGAAALSAPGSGAARSSPAASGAAAAHLAEAATSPAADLYDAAVHHPGRSDADLKRDAIDHPADVLRLGKITPGMRVADVLAADGYYSELLSYVVGPTGHVLMLNNAAYEKWSEGSWKKRLENNRLPNVEYRTVDLERLDLPAGQLDAVLLIKVYHDLYWTDPEGVWPRMDPGAVLNQVNRVLRPGGLLIVVDHSAKPGTGSSDAATLHRIDEAYARHDFESHGFLFVAKSDVLRRPDDKRDLITYKGPAVGKTDRFVYVFRKRAGQKW